MLFSKSLRLVYKRSSTLAPLKRALIRVRARFGEKLRSERKKEHMHAHTRVAELPKEKRRLILNDTPTDSDTNYHPITKKKLSNYESEIPTGSSLLRLQYSQDSGTADSSSQ